MHLPTSQRGQIALIVAGALVVLALLIGLTLYVLVVPRVDHTEEAPAAPITSASVQPNALEQTRQWFGPWSLAPAGATGAPALVMLRNNGALDVSSWTVTVSNDWPRSPAAGLTVSMGAGTVSVRVAGGRVFTVSASQPFILENRPDQVYAINPAGTSPAVVAQTVDWVRTHGHKL